MSLLSKITGIGISRKGIKINPGRALLTAAGVAIPAFGVGKTLGLLGTAGKFFKNNAKTIADYGSIGERVYDRMQENKVAGQAQDRYRSLQPLRDQAMATLMAPTPSTAGIFSDPGTSEGRYRSVSVGSRGRY